MQSLPVAVSLREITAGHGNVKSTSGAVLDLLESFLNHALRHARCFQKGVPERFASERSVVDAEYDRSLCHDDQNSFAELPSQVSS